MVSAKKRHLHTEPPEGWENLKWCSFESFCDSHPAWFDQIARQVKNEIDWRPNATKGATDRQKYRTYVVLSAQLSYWRERARNLEEFLKDEGIKNPVPRSTWDAVLKKASRRAREEREAPKFGGILTYAHNWSANTHHGPDLRAALGYRAKAFQELRKAAGIAAGAKGGRGRAYSFAEAAKLLRVRLQRSRPSQVCRIEIAEEIWDSVKRCPEQQRKKLRAILKAAGAKCHEPPPSKQQPTVSQDVFSSQILTML